MDPAAAAAAYLQRLPLDARAAAPADTARSEILLVASVAIVLIVAWGVGRSGFLQRIRLRLEAAGRPRWIADAACGSALIGLVALAMTPLAPMSAAGASGALGPVLLEPLRQAALFSLLAAIAFPLLYGLMRLLPRLWAPLLGGLSAIAIFAAVWLPFAEASGPTNLPVAPAGAARAGLLGLIADTHLKASEIYITPTRAIDADVTGLGAARVSVSRGLWETASPQELRASIGHLMGHYVHHDQLSIALLLAMAALGLFLTMKALYAPAARLLRLPRDISDPSGAPALIAIATLWICAGVIADHALIRAVNVRADQYSLDHAREPDGLAMTLLHEWRGEDPDPSPLQEALFYDHPSLQSRLLHAMRWKAAHGG
jgi:STE24 endopeptidase